MKTIIPVNKATEIKIIDNEKLSMMNIAIVSNGTEKHITLSYEEVYAIQEYLNNKFELETTVVSPETLRY